MRGHRLHVARHPDYPEDVVRTIECVSPDECGGYQECGEEHIHNGHRAGTDECLCDPGTCACDRRAGGCECPFQGTDEWLFHGEDHVPDCAGGWALPFVGCVVAVQDWEIPDDLDPDELGTWVVHDEWQGPGELTLFLGEKLPAGE